MRRVMLAAAMTAALAGVAAPARADVAPALTYSQGPQTGAQTLTPLASLALAAGSQGDDVTATVNLPFDFAFYGQNYPSGTALKASSNGNLQFTTNSTSYGTVAGGPCPGSTTSIAGPAMLPLWQDLDTAVAQAGPTGGIYTGVTGVAPNRTFIVAWQAHIGTAGTSLDDQFEIRLHETTSAFEYVYGTLGDTTKSSVGVQQGNVAHAAKSVVVCQDPIGMTYTKVSYSTSRPGVSGGPQEGQALTSNNGSFTAYPTPPTYTRQWQQCDGSGSGCADIAGETATTYTARHADIGHTVRYILTATNAAGSASVTSFPSAVIGALPPPAATYTVQHGTGAAIVPGTTDSGGHGDDIQTAVTFPFPVTFYGQSYTAGNLGSNGSIGFGATTDPSSNTSSCLPNAIGTPALMVYQGDLRTDTPGSGIFTAVTGAAPHRRFIVEWRTTLYSDDAKHANFEAIFDEGSPNITTIIGATADTGSNEVVGVQQDLGSVFTQVECTTAASLPEGTSNTWVASAPTIAGTAQPGQQLKLTQASYTGAGVTVTDQWRQCDAAGTGCTDIAGATAATYTATAGDLGRTLRVRETATNPQGSTSTDSVPTAVIANPAPPTTTTTTTTTTKTPPPDKTAPVLGALRVNPDAFRAKNGATVSFKLSEAATVVFGVSRLTDGRKVGRRCVKPARSNRGKPKCTIATAVGSFTRAAAVGNTSFHLAAKIGRRTLAAGRYRLTAVATDAAGNKGKAVSATFKVK